MTDHIFRECRRFHAQNLELCITVDTEGTPVVSIMTMDRRRYRDMTIYGDDGLLIWLQDVAERGEFARQRLELEQQREAA